MNPIVLRLELNQRPEDQQTSEARRDYLVIYSVQFTTSERFQSFDSVSHIYTERFNWKPEGVVFLKRVTTAFTF